MELSKLMAFGMAIGTNLSKDPYRVARETVTRAVKSVKVDISTSLAPVATGLVTGNMDVVRHSLVDVLPSSTVYAVLTILRCQWVCLMV